MASNFYKLEFYVPEEHLEPVKAAIFAAGAGRIGDYECCSWQCRGEGQFRPLSGSHPHIGKVGDLERVGEYKVETVCPPEVLADVIAALRLAHPYETPAYQYWPVKG